MTKKWLTLAALLFGGGTVMNGCLGSFWNGFWNTGWPSGNKWLNLGTTILNEELFG